DHDAERGPRTVPGPDRDRVGTGRAETIAIKDNPPEDEQERRHDHTGATHHHEPDRDGEVEALTKRVREHHDRPASSGPSCKSFDNRHTLNGAATTPYDDRPELPDRSP